MFKIILTIGSIQVLAVSVSYVRTKLVAVLAGPEGVGIISAIDQVVQTASYLSALSLPFASIKFLSRAHSEGAKSFKKTYASFLKALLVLSLVGTALVASAVFFRPYLLGQEVVKYRTFLAIALLGIPTMVLGGFFTQTLAAAQKPKHSSVLTVITGAVLTVASVLGLAVAGIRGLYVGTVVAGLFLTLAVLIYLNRSLDLPFYSRAASFIKELRDSPSIIPFALLLYAAALTYSSAFLVVRYAVLKNYGEASAGLLHAAIALSLAIGLALNPANGLYLTPIMNRNIEKGKKITAAIEFEKKLVIILFLISMPLVLFPNLVITILFSAEFTVAGQFVFLFVAAQCIAQITGVHQALLIGFDDLKGYSILTCTGHILLGGLAWFLIPSFGIFGAAIGFIAAYMIIFISTFLRLRTKHQFAMPYHLTILIVYGMMIVLVSGAVAARYDPWSVPVLASKVGVFTLFAVSLFFCLSKEERNFVYSLLDKIKLRKTLKV